jgi:hypothetical protein
MPVGAVVTVQILTMAYPYLLNVGDKQESGYIPPILIVQIALKLS